MKPGWPSRHQRVDHRAYPDMKCKPLGSQLGGESFVLSLKSKLVHRNMYRTREPPERTHSTTRVMTHQLLLTPSAGASSTLDASTLDAQDVFEYAYQNGVTMDTNRTSEKVDSAGDVGMRLMSYDLSREVTEQEIDMLAGAGSGGGCTAMQYNQCVEMDC